MRVKKTAITAFILFVAAAGLVNYYFLSNDTMPALYDADVCYSASRDYYEAIMRDFRFPDLKILLHNVNCYPPLYMLAALPFYLFNGPDPDVMAMVNLFYLALLAYSVYRIANLLYGRPAGYFSVIMLIFFPGVLGFSRLTHINIALASVFSLSIYLLMKSENFLKRRPSVLLGLAAGIGTLFSFKYCFYIIGPVSISLIQAFGAGNGKTRRLKERAANLLLFLSAMLAVSALYYVPSLLWIPLSLNIKFSAPGVTMANFRTDWFLRRIIEYLAVLRAHTLTPNFLLFLAAVILLRKELFRGKGSMVLFGWLCAPFVIISLWPWVEPRFLLPISPSMAVVISGLFPKLINSLKGSSLRKKAALGIVPIFILGALNAVFFIKEHPYPADSSQLSYRRHRYGMLHVFSRKDSPGSELLSYFGRTEDRGRRFTVAVAFDSSLDSAPLALELIYGELKRTDLNIELKSSMELAVDAWHMGMDGRDKRKYIEDFFRRTDYILYMENTVKQQTSGRWEYEFEDNDRARELFMSDKNNMRLVWTYRDEEGFFTERLSLFKR